MDEAKRITPFLGRAFDGDKRAMDHVAGQVYADLRKMAVRFLAGRAPHRQSVTLDAAALAHDTFIRLKRQKTPFENRDHFFALAKREMTRVLQDHDRKKTRKRHDGARVPISIGALDRQRSKEPRTVDVSQFNLALEQLGKVDARAVRIFDLRVEYGHTNDEIAILLGISRSTVDREWRFVRAWLAARI